MIKRFKPKREYKKTKEEVKESWFKSSGSDDPFLMTKEWRATSKAKLTSAPICECCGENESRDVHHIKPRADYPDLKLDWDNLMAVCKKCHFLIEAGALRLDHYLTKRFRKLC